MKLFSYIVIFVVITISAITFCQPTVFQPRDLIPGLPNVARVNAGSLVFAIQAYHEKYSVYPELLRDLVSAKLLTDSDYTKLTAVGNLTYHRPSTDRVSKDYVFITGEKDGYIITASFPDPPIMRKQ
jgi:hypothetical protein